MKFTFFFSSNCLATDPNVCMIFKFVEFRSSCGNILPDESWRIGAVDEGDTSSYRLAPRTSIEMFWVTESAITRAV